MNRVFICFLLAACSGWFIPSAAFAQATAGKGEVPLTDTAKDVISGDWVHIPALDLEKMVSSQDTFCRSPLFDEENMEFVWAYDGMSYFSDIPILSQASGDLAFRWNGGDDLYLASRMASDKPDGEEPAVAVYRMGSLRMQTAPGKLGISWGWADDIDPENEYASVAPYGTRSNFFIEELKNQTTGQSFLVLAKPLNANYQRTADTKLYAKCPN